MTSIMSSIWRRKPMAVIHAEESAEQLPRTLTLFDLCCIGVGGTIGSGIFSTAGSIISGTAGPAAVLSWIIAGVVACLNSLSYMELTTRIPSSGSTYAYSYHAIGELAAVIAAWMLTLEYAVSGVGVARSWSDKVYEWLVLDYPNTDFGWLDLKYANIGGAVVQGFSVLVLLMGVRFGKAFVNIVTCAKVCVVFVIIIAGFAALDPDNLSPFIPKRSEIDGSAAFGLQGVMTGASQAFFGYVGFDEVCCLAAEAKNPKQTMPKAVLWVVVGTMILSTLCSLVLAGMIPYLEASSFAAGFEGHGWHGVSTFVRAGEVVTMPVVVLIGFIAQPRLQYALACDGLMPSIFAKVDKKGNLFMNTLISGIFFTIMAFVVPFDTLWNIVTFGVMMSFNFTNISLLMVRMRDESPVLAIKLALSIFVTTGCTSFFFQSGYQVAGSNACAIVSALFLVITIALTIYMHRNCAQSFNDTRYFSAPLVPYVQSLCMLANWYMISQLDTLSLVLSIVWVVAAIISYFAYGFHYAAGRTGWADLLSYDTPNAQRLNAPMLSITEPRNSKPTTPIFKPNV